MATDFSAFITLGGTDNTAPATSSAYKNLRVVRSCVEDVQASMNGLIAMGKTFLATWVFSKVWDGFKAGIQVVDEFAQSVTKVAAVITSLQGSGDISGNYQRAKQYAEGLNATLMEVDAKTTLNLSNLQTITEEMIKQGVVLDYNSKTQVDGFTKLANAVAVYSNNGRNEVQVRQEVAALLRGEVDQNSQLASMIQRTVDGPLKQKVEQWKQSGTLVEELGKRLAGFGPAADDLAGSWGAVKSSMETAINLVLRSGFGEIVKDIVTWLGKANDYLKAHSEEIGNRIKQGWLALKGVMQGVFSLFKTDLFKDIVQVIALIARGLALLATSVIPPVMQRFSALFDAIYNGAKAAVAPLMIIGNALMGNWQGVLASGQVFAAGLQGMVGGLKATFAGGLGDDIASRALEFMSLDSVAKRAQEKASIPKVSLGPTEEQKKEAVKAFQERGKILIDIEKDTVKRLLDVQKEYGEKLKDQYKERVSDLDAFRKAMDEVSASKEERDRKRSEELRGSEDQYQRYYRVQQEIAQAESTLDNDGVWTAAGIARKLKAYDNLIKQSENLYEQARNGNIDAISGEQALYDAKSNRERLELKIEEIGTRQIRQLEDSAVAAAAESAAWEQRIRNTEDRIRVLDQMLQNLPHIKQIDINLKINGIEQLMQMQNVMANTKNTTGVQSYGEFFTMGGNTYWTSDGSLADSGTSYVSGYAVGTSYVPRTGLYQLHQGETVKNRRESSQESPAVSVSIGDINVTVPAGTPETTARDTARAIYAELQKLGLRYRAA